MLDKKIPNWTQSRIDFYNASQEQQKFIFNCSMTPGADLDEKDYYRLSLILGGVEPILFHPLSILFAKAALKEQEAELIDLLPFQSMISSVLGGGGPRPRNGLLSFVTHADPLKQPGVRGIQATREETRPIRIEFARINLAHYPRALTGALDNMQGAADRIAYKKAEDAAEKVVKFCEALATEDVPLGDVISTYLAKTNMRDNDKTPIIGGGFFSALSGLRVDNNA